MDSSEEEKHEDDLEEDIGIINNLEAGSPTHKKYLVPDVFRVFCDGFKRRRRSILCIRGRKENMKMIMSKTLLLSMI